MPMRGVLQALTDAQRDQLLAQTTDAGRVELVTEEFGADRNEGWIQDTDKAWSVIAEVLDEPPAGLCILGGRRVLDQEGDDPEWIVRLVEPDQVKEVAAAIAPIDREAFLLRYAEKSLGLTAEERAEEDDLSVYEGDDFVYAWGWFEQIKDFYARAAAAGRAVVFSVDR